MRIPGSITALVLLFACVLCAPARADDARDEADSDPLLQGLAWRCIGPARGGRVSSVAGVRGDRRTYYMGSCGGGVWKTTDAGAHWKNVTDGFVATGSVGALAVAESDPNVVYVGMGEPDPRGNFSHGDGVYRSTNAGKTWAHVGLEKTRQIGRIAVHPQNPDIVYVAALGHVYGPNAERGVYRSKDGGKTWELVHFVDEQTGAVDITLDPFNPRVVYASFWQVSRKPWRLDSGGKGSGLWRSTDGGDTWKRLDKGLPKGLLGRIGVSASAAKRDLVYAVVESEQGGVFRSDDGGDSWRRVNDERKLRQRAWYYSRIQADPQDPETVYVLNVRFHKSVDGGKTYKAIPTRHVDNHAFWIDPDDNQRMVEGNDGGAVVSLDGGATWSRQDNQPTAQFYRVTTDNRFPYRVLGSQQDNSTVSIAHTSRAMNGRDFYSVSGGEAGYIAVRPDDPDIVYGGSYAGWLTRYDHRTGLTRPISPWPENPIGAGAAELTHRFQWTFPIVVSPHDANAVYVGGEVLFRTTNEGQTWDVLSPDLSRNDKTRQASSGGPITQDNTTVEYYGTIFTIAESPVQRGRIWIGTDDGRVHVTDAADGDWREVTPPGLADDALVSLIDASPHDANSAWVAVNRYRSDDFRPLVYRTTDAGATWTSIVEGLPAEAFVRSIREDPIRAGLLYLGTETGVFVSFDAGARWRPLQLKLPVVPVTDVAVKGDDLLIATQGRSFWILSGLSRLRDATLVCDGGASLISPAPAWRGLGGSARIHFQMPDSFQGEASLVFVDAGGRVARTYTIELEQKGELEQEGKDKPTEKDQPTDEDKGPDGGKRRGKAKQAKIKAKPGLNLFKWDMRREPPTKVPGAVGWPNLRGGPRVLPGSYTVRLTVGEQSCETTLLIQRDPRLGVTDAELGDAGAFVDEVFAALDEVHTRVNTIRAVRHQIEATKKRARQAKLWKDLKAPAQAVLKALKEVEEALIQTQSKSPQDPLNYPVRLNDKLTMLLTLGGGDPRPTDAMRAVLASLKARVKVQLDRLDTVLAEQLPAFNQAAAAVPAVVLPDASDE